MGVITETISTQGFERVGNRIGEILIEEISYQKDLQGFNEDVEVFLERLEPFDKNEDVAISVTFKEAEYDNYTQVGSQGNCIYLIELFVTGMGIGNEPPSVNAKNKLFRYLGLIRYILSSGKLPTLGFPPGFIGGKYVHKIMSNIEDTNYGNQSNADGSYCRTAKVFLGVRVQENQSLWDSIPLYGNDTKITYENTSKGIQLIFNN